MWGFRKADEESFNKTTTAEKTLATSTGSDGRDVTNQTAPNRKDSFKMGDLNSADVSELEQPDKARSIMWKQPVVDGKEIESRLRIIHERNTGEDSLTPQIKARIDPGSPTYLKWLAFMILCAAFSATTNGYYIAFYDVFQQFHSVYIAEWAVDFFFLCNIILHLNVGYFNSDGEKILATKKIRRHYMFSTAFVFDVLAFLPLDLLQLSIGYQPALRVNKLLRLWCVKDYIRRLQLTSANPTFINYVVLIRLILIWLLLPNLFCVVRIL